MRHRNSPQSKLGRNSPHRRALFRNMATSLLKHERCETTVVKAKDLRRVVERLITKAAVDSVAARRRAYSYLMSKAVVHKLFTEIAPRYKGRPGGYTRIVRTRHRAGDAAEMAVIELIKDQAKAKPKAKK